MIVMVSQSKLYKSLGLPTLISHITTHAFIDFVYSNHFLPRRIRHFDVFENFEFKRLFQFFHSSLENLVTFCTLMKTATTQGLQIFEWVGASKGRLIPVTSQFKTWAPFQPKINLPK